MILPLMMIVDQLNIILEHNAICDGFYHAQLQTWDHDNNLPGSNKSLSGSQNLKIRKLIRQVNHN